MAATIRALPTDPLMARLAPVAAHVRNASKRLKKLLRFHPHPECATAADFEHFARTAAFEAFLELGGDPAAPDGFDWAGRCRELTRRAKRRLHLSIDGRTTSYGDFRSRCRVNDPRPGRGPRLLPPELPASLDGEGSCEALDPMVDERPALARMAETLEADLAAVLTPKECYVLTEIALRGRRLRDLAREEPHLVSPRHAARHAAVTDFTRVEKALDMVYRRALVRARARLAARRAALVAEAA